METDQEIPAQKTTPTPEGTPPTASKSSSKLIIIILLIIIALLLGVIGYFSLINNQDEDLAPPTPIVTIAPTSQEITPITSSPSLTPTPAVNIDENTKAAIESKNYAALEGYMAPSVSVLLYASECCGPQTKTQAITQLEYLKEAQSPWNWNQSSETIKKIKADHPTTFGKGTVGVANNEYTVSYEVVNGKITSLYLSASYKLLQL